MHAIVTVGVSGSGVSSWASYFEYLHPEYVNINRKKIRASLYKDMPDNLDHELEAHVTTLLKEAIYYSSVAGKNVIISDTNLYVGDRYRLVTYCEELGYTVEIKDFTIDYKTFIDNAKSKGFIREESLDKQWKNWLKYLKEKNNEN